MLTRHTQGKKFAAFFLLLVLATGILSHTAAAFIVHDPVQTSMHAGNWLTQLRRMLEQAQTLTNQYRKQIEQYTKQLQQLEEAKKTLKHLKDQAVWLGGLDRYRAAANELTVPLVRSTYGQTAAWGRALSTRGGAAAAYAQATVPYERYPEPLLGRLDTASQRAVRQHRGDIDLVDAESERILALHGDNTAALGETQAALAALEAISASEDETANTQAALLNKINAATVVSARGIHQTNQLLTPLLHAQALQMKQLRDQQVEESNALLRIATDYPAVARRSVEGTNEALRRMNLAAVAGR